MNTTSVRPHSLLAALLASAAISRYMSRSRSRLGSSAAMSTSTSVSAPSCVLTAVNCGGVTCVTVLPPPRPAPHCAAAPRS